MNFSRASLLDRRYRVTHILAQHDSETHYAARHVALDRHVRLMVSSATPGSDYAEEVCAWTARVAALRHPVLPHVRDCFGHEESMCVVLDEPHGLTLTQRILQRGPLAEREVIAIGLLVADALDHLTRHDATLAPLASITPDALVFLPDDRVTLTYPRPRPLLDRLGACLCPRCQAYQAPEVARGEPADARADIYGLATTLRYALGFSASESAIATSDTNAIEPILARALARDPRDRYESPAAFASALVDVGTALPGLSPATSRASAAPRSHQFAVAHHPTGVSSTTTLSKEPHTPSAAGRGSTRTPRTSTGVALGRHSGRRALLAIASAFHFPG